MEYTWMRIGIQIVTWHLTHFRIPLLVHSSTWPGCGINRSYLAVYISCVAVWGRLRAFTADWMIDYTFHWKSRILQDPHAAGMNKIDFVFVDIPYLQGGLPHHCRKSLIYCLIKFRMNPLLYKGIPTANWFGQRRHTVCDFWAITTRLGQL